MEGNEPSGTTSRLVGRRHERVINTRHSNSAVSVRTCERGSGITYQSYCSYRMQSHVVIYVRAACRGPGRCASTASRYHLYQHGLAQGHSKSVGAHLFSHAPRESIAVLPASYV